MMKKTKTKTSAKTKTTKPSAETNDKQTAANERKTRLLIALLCIGLSAFAVAPFFFMGRSETGGGAAELRMPTTHDMFLHYDQMRSFYNGLAAGEIYPRWEEDTNRGFGAPTTSFYPPGVYYLTSAFYAITRDWLRALLDAHLAMMIGYSSDVPELDGKGGNAGVSSRVQAVVDLYGPTDFTDDSAKSRGEIIRFLGGKKFDDAPDVYRLASPITHVTKDDPPTLILHGSIDSTVSIHQADLLVEKLKAAGVECELDRVEGWPHTMDLEVNVNRHCIAKMFEFFDKHLGMPTDNSSARK